MKIIVCAAMGIAASLGWAPLAGADPSEGHYTFVTTTSPSMTCVVASDDVEPGVGPNVVCQGDGFPGSPIDPDSAMHLDQAVVTAAGTFAYRNANIPTGGDDFDPHELAKGDVYHVQGWTIELPVDGVTFTNDATGHGMAVTANRSVKAF